MIKILFSALFLLQFISCAHRTTAKPVRDDYVKVSSLDEEERQRSLFQGNWYGEKPDKNGAMTRWLVEHKKDGTYFINYLIQTNETASLQQRGLWGISGDIYFTIARDAIHNDQITPLQVSPHNYNAYQILEVNEEKLVIRSREFNETMSMKKVDAKFELK